ncbi:MAG: lysophospholipid acyltransferase family protein [Bacteroidales bacterium]|jgi:KDO2-lipid IV(A) lauroyltransferase
MKIFYIIFSIKAWFISILPFRLLYILSDFYYFLLYYVIGYRKKVVFENLRKSFPDKTSQEIEKIAKKYFHNLCDMFLEVIKVKNISEKQILKRVKIKNIEVLDELYLKNKSVIVAMGHLGNWEFTTHAVTLKSAYNHYGLIKPLTNDFFNNYLNKLRNRFNLKLVPYKQTLKFMARNKNNLSLYYVAGDQTPAKGEITYWTNFLNQDTPVYLGIEKMSKMLDFAVIFMDIQHSKRGYYEIEFTKFTDKPNEFKEFEITEWHVRFLENIIIKNPDNWLWSHKRWKHKKA